MIGLDGKKIISKGKAPSPFDLSCSIELLSALNKQKKYPRNTIVKEAYSFRLLREVDQVPLERIDQVLAYHCSQLREQYHPQAYSSKKFREKFQAIEAAFRRANPVVEVVPISSRTESTIVRLRMLGWKKYDIQALKTEVQISDNWVTSFRIQVRTFANKSEEWTRKYFEELLRRLPTDWTERHYEGVHRRIHNWDQWSGNMKPFRLSWSNKEVKAYIRTLLNEYGGERQGGRYFDLLSTEIEKHASK